MANPRFQAPLVDGGDASDNALAPGSAPATERRASPDRRGTPTRFRDAIGRLGRRGSGRREGDSVNSYVDHYTLGDVGLLVAIFLLNIADAFFTLEWLGRGGSEGNPLVDDLITRGHSLFVIQKTVVVGFWLLLLTIHKNFRVARAGMWMLLGVYVSLLLYHLMLFFFGEPT